MEPDRRSQFRTASDAGASLADPPFSCQVGTLGLRTPCLPVLDRRTPGLSDSDPKSLAWTPNFFNHSLRDAV
jgi:hypothetical protein